MYQYQTPSQVYKTALPEPKTTNQTSFSANKKTTAFIFALLLSTFGFESQAQILRDTFVLKGGTLEFKNSGRDVKPYHIGGNGTLDLSTVKPGTPIDITTGKNVSVIPAPELRKYESEPLGTLPKGLSEESGFSNPRKIGPFIALDYEQPDIHPLDKQNVYDIQDSSLTETPLVVFTKDIDKNQRSYYPPPWLSVEYIPKLGNHKVMFLINQPWVQNPQSPSILTLNNNDHVKLETRHAQNITYKHNNQKYKLTIEQAGYFDPENTPHVITKTGNVDQGSLTTIRVSSYRNDTVVPITFDVLEAIYQDFEAGDFNSAFKKG